MRRQRNTFLVAWVLVSSWGPAFPNSALEIEISNGFAGAALTLEARGPGDEIERLTVPAGAKKVSWDLPAGPWKISCQGPEVWCAEVELLGEQQSLVEFVAFSTIRTEATLARPRNEMPPQQLTIQGWVRATAKAKAFPLQLSAQMAGEGAEFRLPRGLLDLRLSAEGWTPVYRWGVDTREGERLDLGSVELRRGGSLAGMIVDGEQSMASVNARVLLRPAGSQQLSSQNAERLGSLVLESRSNRHGFFQFHDVEAGRYQLEVAVPGRAVFRAPSLEIVEAEELYLSEILLRPLVQLTVAVEPAAAVDKMPWAVHLRHRLRGSGEDLESATDSQGLAYFADVEPGEYILELALLDGFPAMRQDLNLTEDQTVELRLDVIPVVGYLRAGEEPLQGRIELRTGNRDIWSFDSDETGRFEGEMRLPERALFARVLVDDPELTTQLRLHDLALSEGKLRLDIDVGGRAITGRVLSPLGLPIGGAEVEASTRSGDSKVRTRSDQGGRFALSGLGAEEVHLRARKLPEGVSEAVLVQLGKDGAKQVDLQLLPVEIRSGRVVGANGRGEAGARIEALVSRPATLVNATTTDLSGKFEIELPKGATRVVFQVQASLLWSGCLQLAPEGNIEIRVPSPSGGEAILDLLGDEKAPPAFGGEVVLLTEDRGFLSVGTLLGWRLALGQMPAAGSPALAFPLLAPGLYALHWRSLPWWVLVDELCFALTSSGKLDWKQISPGGAAYFDFDVSPYQR